MFGLDDRVKSKAIRAVHQLAEADGNSVETIAQWSKALVVHMRSPLSERLKAKIEEAVPEVRYYEEKGTPHNPADRGYVDDEFMISFPWPDR